MTDKTCPTPGPFLLGICKEQLKGRLFRPPCKRWSCPVCGLTNAAEWGFVAFYGAHKLMQDEIALSFITVTSHEKLDAQASMDVWPTAWKKLHTRLTRQYGKGQYFMVKEQHKTGRLHVHAVVTWKCSQKWLKDNARACGLGYQARVVMVDHAPGVASYVTKYLSKFGYEWPKGWRRVNLSRGWPKMPEGDTGPEGWRHVTINNLARRDVLNLVADHASAGITIDVQDGLLDALEN